MRILCKSVKDCSIAAEKILKEYPSERVFALYGSLGTGKTTLIKAFCRKLGAVVAAKSPSFAIINEYAVENCELQTNKIYHFDFYRILKEEEAFDIGYEEYFYSNNYCFIEWAERIENLLPPKYIRIDISEIEKQQRLIIVELKVESEK